MNKPQPSLWDTFSYLTTNQKKSIIELTNCYERPNLGKKDDSESLPLEKNDVLINVSENEKNEIESQINELIEYKKYLKEESAKTDEMIDKIEKIQINCHKIVKIQQEIDSINESSLLKMAQCRKDVHFLEEFILKMAEIEKLENTIIKNTEEKETTLNLNKIDSLSNYLNNYKNFREYSHYSSILEIKRGQILNDIFIYSQKILLDSTNATVESLKDEIQITYHIIVNEFKKNSQKFSEYFKFLSDRINSHIQYDSIVNIIIDEYVKMRMGLIKGLISSSLHAYSFNIQEIEVDQLRFIFLLFIRILNDESYLFKEFFHFNTPKLDDYLKSINLILQQTLTPFFIKISNVSKLCLFARIIKDEFNQKIYGDYEWWDTFLESSNILQSEMQSRISYLVQKFIIQDIEKYVLNFEEIVPNPLLQSIFKLFDELFPSLPKNLFEKMSQRCIDSVMRLYDIVDLKEISIQNIQKYLLIIRDLLAIREKLSSFNVNFISKDIFLEFGDLIEAATTLYKNKSKIFSLNSNNALLTFIIMGAPKLSERWIDSKKEIELKIRNYCFGFIELTTNYVTSSFINMIKMIEETKIAKNENEKTLFRENLAEFYQNFRITVSKIKEKMHEALNDSDTENILFKPIRTNVCEKYKNFVEKARECFKDDETIMILLISPEEISLMLSSNR